MDEDGLRYGMFTIKRQRHRVCCKNNTLQWSLVDTEGCNQKLSIEDVISVNVKDNDPNVLQIHYAHPIKNHQMRMSRHEFIHEDPTEVLRWHDALNQKLSSPTIKKSRPRVILALINPHCGRRRGVETFKKFVVPIFNQAGVKVKDVITESGLHGPELVSTCDLTPYDAILCVGGDGTVSEIANALMRRRLKELGVDLCDREAVRELPVIEIPLIVIPAGSTDCIAYTLNGTADPQTAAIYAVLGDVVGVDVCSLVSMRGFQKVFISTLGYGFLGDVVKSSEKYRWMGPKRYEYTGALKVAQNRRYFCQVLITSEGKSDLSICSRDCADCSKIADDDIPLTRNSRYQEEALTAISKQINLPLEPPRRKTIRGSFFWLTISNISCACARSPLGVAPYAHVGDGYMTVLLLAPDSRLDLLKLLLRASSRNLRDIMANLPFAKGFTAQEIEFQALDKDFRPSDVDPMSGQAVGSSVWNCDGEVVQDTNLRIRCHRQVFRVFSRRPCRD